MKTQLKFIQVTYGPDYKPLDEVGLWAVDALRYSRLYITEKEPSDDEFQKMVDQFVQDNPGFRFDRVELLTAVT